MPAQREMVVMILDALWNEKPIRWYYEDQARSEAGTRRCTDILL
jgi:hypothetical protein